MSEKTCNLCDERLTAFEHTYCRGCEHELRCDGFDDYELTPEEEAAAERAYENSRARAEWDSYHPGEPCPDIELPHPRKSPP